MSLKEILIGTGGGGSHKELVTAKTVFKLGTNGLVGAQNNTFLDTPTNSRTANTITRYGNVTQGTFSPYTKEAGKWSNAFVAPTDGSAGGAYMYINNGTPLNFQGSDFKVSLDFYINEFTSWGAFLLSGSVNNSLLIAVNTSSTLVVRKYGVADIITVPNISKNKWYSLALKRVGSVLTLTLNGTDYVVNGFSHTFTDSSVTYVGWDSVSSYGGLRGYISNLKITKAGVVVLDTCKDNRFKDSSPYNHVLTPTGNVKVSPFSPYANSAGYDAMVYGGSGYFDGGGDYLQYTPSQAQLGSGDFNIKVSVFSASASQQFIWGWRSGNATSGYLFISGSSVPEFGTDSGTANLTSSTAIKLNAWNDIEVDRTGTTLTMKLNGVVVATQLNNTNNYSYSGGTDIGAANGTNSYFFSGYISNLLITKAGTEVLNLKFANAGIRDESGMNNIETVGDAKVSSYGQGVVFDGNGDYLNYVFEPLGTSDFNISFTSRLVSNAGSLLDCRSPDNGNAGFDMYIQSGVLKLGTAGANYIVTSYSHPTNTDVLIELTRSNHIFTLKANGTSIGTYNGSTAQNFTNSIMRVGYGLSSGVINGTIKNLTITKG